LRLLLIEQDKAASGENGWGRPLQTRRRMVAFGPRMPPMDRRDLFQAGLTALAGAVTLPAVLEAAVIMQAAGAATESKPLGAHALTAPFEGWTGTMLEVTYPPGARSASHQHPGPTFGYVVKGSILWAINGEPAKTLTAGQTFFEPLGSIHSTSANASATEPAVISVVIVGRTGEPLSKPATARTP
jgi:quercetin dioxygenase-like cupin family protein